MTWNVLYAEDDHIQSVVVSSLLKQEGFTVTLVGDGKAALQALADTRFDVVLTDHYMPQMSGMDLLSELRSQQFDIPLVMMTSAQDMQLVFSVVRAGADDFISKDMKGQYLDMIVPVINRACERHQLQVRVRRHAEQLEREKNLCLKTLDAMEEGVIVINDQLCITYQNSFFSALFPDETSDNLLGRDIDELIALFCKRVDPLLTDDDLLERTALVDWLRDGDGTREIVIDDRILDAKKVKVSGTGYAVAFVDITQQKRANEYIEYVAHHDELTGLPNRTLMRDRIETALRRVRRTGSRMGVLVLDLDHFKRINDSLGHVVGDELLKTVALRLVSAVRESDTVCRMGGDEFVVILPDVHSRQDVERICHKILDLIAQPIQVGLNTLNVTPSIGLSMAPEDGDTEDDLLKHADIAMYRAKHTGRNGYFVFSREMAKANHEEMMIEQALHQAFLKNCLQLHYQPKVDINNHEINGFEALIRWIDPVRGPIAPDRFIPMAETTGYIISLGEWVLNQACKDMQALREQTGLNFRVSVNVSPRQLEQPEFVNTVRRALQQSGLPPQGLELEITEGVLVAESGLVLDILRELHDMGVLLAIDDFGTGFCSLAYVAQYPIDVIKIDRCFIDVDQKSSKAIVGAITTIAEGLGLEVVAEGVETQEQIELVRGRGCNVVQGFYFYQAMSLQDLAPLLPQVSQEVARKLALH